MKKRIAIVLLVLLLVAVAAVGFSACNKKGEDMHTITVWAGGQWVGSDFQNLKAFINDYNQSNTLGLTVEVVAKSDMETALATAVRNNKVPDMLIWDRFNTPTYSKTDALLDVTSYIERDKLDLTIFNNEAMTEMGYGGKYYGLPLDLDVWGTYINMDKVDAYNSTASAADKIVLTDDWTWDDLYNIAKKLTEYEGGEMKVAGYSGHVMHQHFFKYLTSTSQSFFDADGNPEFDTTQARDVLKFFYKVGSKNNGIWENGLVEKSSFASGRLAMIDQSLYFTDYLEIYGTGINYKFMPQPRYSVDGVVQPGAVNGGMLGGFGIAFPKPVARYVNDEFYQKFELSWSVAKEWVTSETLQTKWAEDIGTLPVLNSLYDDDLILNAETLNRAASFIDDYKIRPQVPSYLTMQTQIIDKCIREYTEGAATLEQTITSLTTGCEQYMLNL